MSSIVPWPPALPNYPLSLGSCPDTGTERVSHSRTQRDVTRNEKRQLERRSLNNLTSVFFFLNPWQKACRKAKPATDLKNGPFSLFYNQRGCPARGWESFIKKQDPTCQAAVGHQICRWESFPPKLIIEREAGSGNPADKGSFWLQKKSRWLCFRKS